MHVFIKMWLQLFNFVCVHSACSSCSASVCECVSVSVSVYGVSVCIEVLEFTVLIIINIIIHVSADIYSVYNR